MKWFINTDKIKICSSPWSANKFTFKRIVFYTSNRPDLIIIQIFPFIISIQKTKKIIRVKSFTKP